MMGNFQRKYVSQLVPKNPRITATLLVLVAIVNSMVHNLLQLSVLPTPITNSF